MPNPLQRTSLLIVALVLLCGCAQTHQGLVLDPIGPESGARAGLLSGGEGYLRVLTKTATINSGGIEIQQYTGYWIYTPEGKKVRGVINHVGSSDQSPMTVELPAGSYVIYAPSDRFGLVKIPAMIVGNRLTMIALEGAGLDTPANPAQTNLVRLPDGRIAGFRAPQTVP